MRGLSPQALDEAASRHGLHRDVNICPKLPGWRVDIDVTLKRDFKA